MTSAGTGEPPAGTERAEAVLGRQRPLVTLKAAVTLDGRIATRTGDSKWITGETARREAHRMREAAGVVMVGVGTVLADDPSMRVHMLDHGTDPIRIVLDTHLRTPPRAKVVAHGSSAPTWIIHGPDVSVARRAALERPGVVCVAAALDGERLDLAAVLAELARRGVEHLLVEGGSLVHGALLDADLADRAAIFVAPVVLGDRAARPLCEQAHPAHTMAQGRRLMDVRIRALGEDVLVEGRFAPRAANP